MAEISELKPTRKQKALVDYIAAHPKESNTEAAMQVYNAENRKVANVIAAKTLKKPVVLEYMERHELLAQKTVINVLKKAKKNGNAVYQRLALDSANSILDRVHGKATQRIDSNSTVISFGIDLTTPSEE